MEQILKYFDNLTTKQRHQFEAIGPLYVDWNKKINVISRKDIDNLYEHHILHSLAIAKCFSFEDGAVVLDAGTGGGFPGLPLAIMYPEVNFVLVDSTAKKLKVVDDICNKIGINNITTMHIRLEDLDGKYDYVVSRAVTRLDTMWNLVKSHLSTNQESGLIYLKGGDTSQELPSGVNVKTIKINKIFTDFEYYIDKNIVFLYKK